MREQVHRWGNKYEFWLTTIIFTLGVASCIWILRHWVPALRINEAATSVGSVITAVGVLLAFRSLRATHEWNRRHFTILLMEEWNTKATCHIQYLQRHLKGYFPAKNIFEPEQRKGWRLESSRAKQLVEALANPADKDSDFEIADRLILLFNYFEDISIAYELRLIDDKAAEETFAPVMLDVFLYFEPFIDEMSKVHRRYPWPPLVRLMTDWLDAELLRKLQAEADILAKKRRAAETRSRRAPIQ